MSGGTAPLVHYLGIRWRALVSSTSPPHFQQGRSSVGWTLERFWTFRTTENSIARAENRTRWTDGDIVVLLSIALNLQVP